MKKEKSTGKIVAFMIAGWLIIAGIFSVVQEYKILGTTPSVARSLREPLPLRGWSSVSSVGTGPVDWRHCQRSSAVSSGSHPSLQQASFCWLS